MDAAERRRHLGSALLGLEAGHYQEAEAACAPVCQADGTDLEALLLFGIAIAARGQATRAAAILDRVARERPDQPHPCAELAGLPGQLPHSQVAAQFQACLRLAPDDTRLHAAFANFLHESGQMTEAIPVLEDWLQRDPDAMAAHNLMGIVQSDLGDFLAAIAHFSHAVRIAPQHGVGWANLGMLLKVTGQMEQALEAYRQAVARSPDNPRIRVNRAVALLQAGRWTEAWPEYEWRLRLPSNNTLPLDRLLPALSQIGSLAGRTVLATHEEGFGDTIHFLRYLPMLAARGAHVFAWVPAPLERLMRRVPGLTAVLSGDLTWTAYDYHCPFFSLPRAFETTVATIPGQPYLTADPDLAAEWAAQLPVGGLRVGLVWAGQARPWLEGFAVLDRRRSVSLTDLAPLAEVPGVQFISLQKGPAAAEAATPPPGMHLMDPTEALTDFADTAALIANLDLVVSVDTAVVHLAGAMGKPVFLLDRYDNCWRWLSGRSDSPWYPNLTIFRQSEVGDWTNPIARAAAALDALARFRGNAATGSRPYRAPEWQGVA